MKKNSVIWMLATMGVLGSVNCSGVKDVACDEDTQKVDTAMVLKKDCGVNNVTRIDLITRDGEVKTIQQKGQADYMTRSVQMGDRVLLGTDGKGNMRITENLSGTAYRKYLINKFVNGSGVKDTQKVDTAVVLKKDCGVNNVTRIELITRDGQVKTIQQKGQADYVMRSVRVGSRVLLETDGKGNMRITENLTETAYQKYLIDRFVRQK